MRVEADRTSHAWPLTLHGCSVGTDTLTAHLYEVHEEDSETERTSVEAEVTVTPPRMYAPAVTAGGGSLDVYWTELSAEHAITRYVVRHKLTADPDVPSSWTPSSPAAASDPKPKALTGLSNRSYDVQIRGCTNDNICGPWSESTPGTPVPVITIEAQQSEVTEGDNVVFTLKADPVPENDLIVRVDVSQMPQGADFLDGAAPTEKKIASGSATAELRVRLDNDDVDEEDGKITVIVQAGTGYVIASPPPEVSVAVLDNDAPPAPAGLRANGRGGQITLRWDKGPTAVSYYQIEYAEERCLPFQSAYGTDLICSPQPRSFFASSENPTPDFTASEVTIDGEDVIQASFTPEAIIDWRGGYGSSDPLYWLEIVAVNAAGEASFPSESLSVYPDLPGTDNKFAATITFLDHHRTSGVFNYAICDDSIPSYLYTDPLRPTRTRQAIVDDIENAMGSWERHVRWWTGSRNIITAQKTGVQSGCQTPRMRSQSNQVMFASKAQMAYFGECADERVVGCYSRDTIMILDEPGNYDLYDDLPFTGYAYLHALIVHEAGHAYGLDHARTEGSVMHSHSGWANPSKNDIVAMMAYYQSR